MKVFISWSGELSHKVALALRDWLPRVIQTIQPYVSSEDIEKGERWSADIAGELQSSIFGILCITKDNSESPWINFEAGALSRIVDKSRVSPFLFDMQPSDIHAKSPLLQFQATLAKKEDVLKLLKSLNASVVEPEKPLDPNRLEEAAEVWWSKLEENLGNISKKFSHTEKKQKGSPSNENSSAKVLEELLQLARQQNRILSNPMEILPPNYLKAVIKGLRADDATGEAPAPYSFAGALNESRWTDERIALLKKMWHEGSSASEIAKELGNGVTRNAVIGKAHRSGLDFRPSSKKDGDED